MVGDPAVGDGTVNVPVVRTTPDCVRSITKAEAVVWRSITAFGEFEAGRARE